MTPMKNSRQESMLICNFFILFRTANSPPKSSSRKYWGAWPQTQICSETSQCDVAWETSVWSSAKEKEIRKA